MIDRDRPTDFSVLPILIGGVAAWVIFMAWTVWL